MRKYIRFVKRYEITGRLDKRRKEKLENMRHQVWKQEVVIIIIHEQCHVSLECHA